MLMAGDSKLRETGRAQVLDGDGDLQGLLFEPVGVHLRRSVFDGVEEVDVQASAAPPARWTITVTGLSLEDIFEGHQMCYRPTWP
jgi:hypothetical protein